MQARLAVLEGESAKHLEMAEALSGLQTKLADAQHQIGSERSAWHDRAQSLQARLIELEQEAAAAQRAIEEERAAVRRDQLQLVELTNELQAAQSRFKEERRQWDEFRQRQPQEPEAQAEAPAETAESEANTPPASPLGEIVETFLAPADTAATPSQPDAAEVAFEAPSPDAPVSTADLLSRFGLSLDADEHDDRERRAPSPPEAGGESSDVQNASEARPRPAGHEDEEDSIDAYMAQLMARLGKPGYAAVPEEAPRPRPAVEESPADTVAETAAEPEDEPLPPEKLRDPSEMVRRAPAPELSADLSAMREIANLNARSALDEHQQRMVYWSLMGKAMVALMGLVAAVVEGWFALEGDERAPYFAAVGLSVAFVWTWQYARMKKATSSTAPS
ncbi:MAG: hypothetical protein B7Z73_14660 [Planctomycetia bacterium 21-64-5]|nr:MAG: hypothetical protein B7Z73_14660 [Planctomycetia bacterium 21-64-5]